ncbi:MAG: J domain-containing protein [Candidatus Woesearchaeota archaeon]
MVKIKGYEVNQIILKDSFQRRALASKNSIIKNLQRLGVHEDDIDFEFSNIAMSKKPASVSWYMDNYFHKFSYSGFKFAENIAMINKVLSLFIQDIQNGEKSFEEFSSSFKEDESVDDKRELARKYFELEEEFSLDDVNKKYKFLSKKLHPDMPSGDLEKFKELNEMHKVLKREFS